MSDEFVLVPRPLLLKILGSLALEDFNKVNALLAAPPAAQPNDDARDAAALAGPSFLSLPPEDRVQSLRNSIAQPSNALSYGFDEALFNLARKDDYMGIYLEMRKRLVYIGKHDGSAEIVDLSPAMRDGAVRDRLIELGWGPPA